MCGVVWCGVVVCGVVSSCVSEINIIFFLLNILYLCLLQHFNADYKLYFDMNVRPYVRARVSSQSYALCYDIVYSCSNEMVLLHLILTYRCTAEHYGYSVFWCGYLCIYRVKYQCCAACSCHKCYTGLESHLQNLTSVSVSVSVFLII